MADVVCKCVCVGGGVINVTLCVHLHSHVSSRDTDVPVPVRGTWSFKEKVTQEGSASESALILLAGIPKHDTEPLRQSVVTTEALITCSRHVRQTGTTLMLAPEN